MSQMPKDVEQRIRALPGNSTCSDCSQLNPQWASVSYGSLMCLECSGQHRALGVHLSFVRSIAMDSWSERQIAAMERSGGNAKLVEFFTSKGIDKSMRISAKYNTKQAAYYKERLSRWLDGKTEPPPDPGRYDPATGGSEAQGAEPLPGETTDQYNERQARLRMDARERLRAKFGDNGISGMGSGMGGGPPPPSDSGLLGGVVGGVGSFLKNNVLENEKVRGVVGGATGIAGQAISNLRVSVSEGNVINDLKSNVSLEHGSTVHKSLSFVGDTVGSILGKESGPRFSGGYAGAGGFTGGNSSHGLPNDDEDFFASIGAKRVSGGGSTPGGYGGSPAAGAGAVSGAAGGRAANGGGSAARAPASTLWDQDDWGETADLPAKASATKAPVVSQLAKDFSGLDVGAGRAPAATAPPVAAKPAPAPAPVVREPVAPMPAAPVKKAAVKLADADDFFAEFGV